VTLSLSPREPERQRGGGNIAIGQMLPYRPRDRDSVWDGGSALGGRAVECVVLSSINTVFNSISWAIGILKRKCHGSVTEVSRKCHGSVTEVSRKCHGSVTEVSQYRPIAQGIGLVCGVGIVSREVGRLNVL